MLLNNSHSGRNLKLDGSSATSTRDFTMNQVKQAMAGVYAITRDNLCQLVLLGVNENVPS
ncbi:hypothetical protein A2U01_0066394, partial [Trifolium medium]|nr:hypothetical protein [Trifolium medium]